MPIDVNCRSIAGTIADYRAGEVPPMDEAHVQRWLEQFPANVRDPLSAEVAHVLARTYLSKSTVAAFISDLIVSADFAGPDPAMFWRGVAFLHLQTAGRSQADMLALFDAALQARLGLTIADCGQNPHTYVYLDDAVFSGGRVKSDLCAWLRNAAPTTARVAVIAMVIHSLGKYFAGNDIATAASAAGKSVTVQWSARRWVEDRKAYMSDSDVLRPTSTPSEADAYLAQIGAEPVLRTGGGIGALKLFSSAGGRDLIEQEFLKAGVRVRVMCPLLPQQMRPLGSMLMRTTGFGSLFVTYRNCANNTPLVFWAGNPWYPLFPRRTN